MQDFMEREVFFIATVDENEIHEYKINAKI
jgi:hypothetical protein